MEREKPSTGGEKCGRSKKEMGMSENRFIIIIIIGKIRCVLMGNINYRTPRPVVYISSAAY